MFLSIAINWFDKSAKRKGKLTQYFKFCNQDYQAVLKHLSVRWLLLERCMERILKKLLVLLFNSAAESIFTNFNRLLQREEPTIDLSNSSMEHLCMKLAKRIIKPIECRNTTVAEIDLSDDSRYIDTMFIFLGGTMKFTLNRLLNSGSITESQFVTFHQSAHEYDKQTVSKYIQQKFPIEDEVICNSGKCSIFL